MPIVYVLVSLKNGKRYVGYTAQALSNRLKQHNEGAMPWARQNKPFQMVHCEEYPDESFSRKRERFLKSGHGRAFLNRLLGEK